MRWSSFLDKSALILHNFDVLCLFAIPENSGNLLKLTTALVFHVYQKRKNMATDEILLLTKHLDVPAVCCWVPGVCELSSRWAVTYMSVRRCLVHYSRRQSDASIPDNLREKTNKYNSSVTHLLCLPAPPTPPPHDDVG